MPSASRPRLALSADGRGRWRDRRRTAVLATERLSLPTNVSSWDPALTRIDGRWHVAFVESPSQAPFMFHPALAVGPAGADGNIRCAAAFD